MNNFYARLNLPPKEKLLNYDLLPVDNNIWHENLFKMYPPTLLTNEAIEFFNDYNLKVKFVVNFITPLSMCPGTKSDRVLHTDNRTVNGIKVPIVCGINFELSMPTDTTWVWYDMDAVPTKMYREHKDSSEFETVIKMRAEVYNDRGVPNGAIPIESLSYNASDIYLIRTDIPHMVTYDSFGKPRSSISIRFEETWKTWDECWEVFRPLMKNKNSYDD